MITKAKIAVFLAAISMSMAASANVTYKWVGDASNTGYAKNVQIELVLSDNGAYGGASSSCAVSTMKPCVLQPGIDLVSLSFGINYFWMSLQPQVFRYDGSYWDISVDNFANNLVGRITAGDYSDDLQMSSVGDSWTIQRIGSDRGIVLNGVSGRFEVVPEPGPIGLLCIAAIALVASRRHSAK